jgi:hypothetical protein
MGHETWMIPGQTFVLVGDGQVIAGLLWIEDHHRDVKPAEHDAGNERMLTPLERRKCGWTRHSRSDRIIRPHHAIESREKRPLPVLGTPGSHEHVEQPIDWQISRGDAADDSKKHVEFSWAGNVGGVGNPIAPSA